MVTDRTCSLIHRLGGRVGGGAAAGLVLHLAFQRRHEGLNIGAQVHDLILRNPNNKEPSMSHSISRIT
jgi:hypothetical protein